MLQALFRFIVAPLYNRFMHLVAYGPWGKFVHGILISLYKNILKIEYSSSQKFDRLGDFFLRPVQLESSSEPLVSPVEASLLDGPRQVDFDAPIRIKGLNYFWSELPEFDPKAFSKAFYWNFYLSPRDYHWFHAACSGSNLQAYRHSGASFPVNAFGRWLCPRLYSENERLSFRWQNPDLGAVLLIAVGAMGVSKIRSELGHVEYGKWSPLKPEIERMSRLGAFELGSTVILVVEKYQSFRKLKEKVLPGEPLLLSSKS